MHSKLGRGRRALAATMVTGLLLVACGGDEEPQDDGDTAEEPADTGDEGGTEGEDAEEGGDEGEAAPDADAFADAPQVEIVFGHPFPDQHHLAVNVLQPWMDEVTEMTDGTVTFDVQPAGALSGAPDNYEHPAAGVTDMGWALHGYTPGQFPITQIIELPFLFDSAVSGTEALWDLYEEFPAFQEEYSEVQPLALWAHDIGDLFTVSEPVESADDVAGLSIRTPAPMQNALVETLGGSAVGMPSPELYDSLDRGVIDGLMIGHSGVPTFGLEEVLGHVTRGNFFVGTMFVVMNPDTWDSLSPEQQAVFEETAFEDLSMALAEDMDNEGGAAADQFEEWGFEIHELDDAQLQEWRDATSEVPQQWIDSMPDDVPAQEMYERVQELAGIN